MKIVTYNIHGGIGMDGKMDLSRIAAVLRRENADFICLNEVDVDCVRTGHVDTMAVLDKELGLNGYFSCALAMTGPTYEDQGDEVGSYGNAMLSPHPFRLLTQFPLPGTPEMEPRSCAIAEIAHPDGTFLAVATHLCWRPEEEPFRVKSIEMITRIVKKLAGGRPAVLCGDFNTEPTSATVAKLHENWLMHGDESGNWPASWPANAPYERDDYIGLLKQTGRESFLTVDLKEETVASDHRPLVAEVSVF